MPRIAVVHTLSPGKLKRISAQGRFDRIVYLQSTCPAERLQQLARIPLRQTGFNDDPPAFFRHHEWTYDWIETLSPSRPFEELTLDFSSRLGLPVDHCRAAVKKTAVLAFSREFQALTFGARLSQDNSVTVFVREPGLFQPLDLKGVSLAHDPESNAGLLIRAAGISLKLALAILRPVKASKASETAAIVFEQEFPEWNDSEFLAFYRYLKTRDDVVFVCPPGSEKLARLRSQGRRAEPRAVTVRGIGETLRQLGVLAGLLASLGKHAEFPSGLRLAGIKLLEHRLRISALLSRHRPRLYLKVRADMDPFHPVTTAIAETIGTANIGYSCGSYSYFSSTYAHIDFHRYGLLGHDFRDRIFRRAWPRSARYLLFGPFTVESADPPKEASRPPGPPVVAAFSTSTGTDFFAADSFFRSFVRDAVAAAAASKARLLFKDKLHTPQRLEIVRAESQGKVELELLPRTSDGDPASSTIGILSRCDAALVMGGSTISWEALGAGKKVLVYRHPAEDHPFSRYSPRLVAHDPATLRESLQWLLGASQEEYERYSAPALAACAKRSDGRLVKDFIESIENEA